MRINIEELSNLVIQCGDILMQKRNLPLNIETKPDGTQVTDVDKEVNKIIQDYIQERYPTFGIMSEELDKNTKQYTWYIDPLNGTKGYINGTNRFNILIGLVRDNKPIFGMIYHPTNQRLYVGGEDETPKIITNTDATPLKKAPPVQENLLYVPSNNWEKKFKEDLFQNETDYKFVYEDSLGSEFKDSRIHVVEGGFNIQVNNNPIGWGSWDICAGHAILSCFGGVMTDFQGNDIDYSKSILKTGFITADSIERINNLPWIKGYSKK